MYSGITTARIHATEIGVSILLGPTTSA